LNNIKCHGPLSIEWEDSGMSCEAGFSADLQALSPKSKLINAVVCVAANKFNSYNYLDTIRV